MRGKPFGVEVSRQGLESLLQRARDGADGIVSFVMEPTGFAWMPVAAYLQAAGHPVYLTKPQKLSDLRKFYRRHTKTDVTDATAAAHLPQIDPKGVHPLRVPTAQETTFRQLVRRRERLARESGAHKRRIHALLVLANPGLMKAFGQERFSKSKVQFLRQYVDPQKVLQLGEKRLASYWRRSTKNRCDPELATRVFESCRTAVEFYGDLRSSSALPFDYEALQDEVSFELDEMERKEQVMRTLDKQIDQHYVRIDPHRTLEQLRGVSHTIAAAVEALIGDVRRFSSSKQFVSYCGLAPRKKQTGISDPHMPITKAGNRLLKKYLYLAADVARQWDPDFAAYYAKRYGAGAHHNHILIALARKMACRMYSLLKRREQSPSASTSGSSVRYHLRDPEGREISAQAARTLIVAKFARKTVAPEREAADRRRKERAENPSRAASSGRSENATRPVDGPPAIPVTLGELTTQVMNSLLKKSRSSRGEPPPPPPREPLEPT
jgi:transposase